MEKGEYICGNCYSSPCICKRRPPYAAWIHEHVPTPEAAFGNCRYISGLMTEFFPELRQVRGFYHCTEWGRRGHWWCVTSDGAIVDPTALQFPSAGRGDYEEFTGSDDELATGTCYECGEDVFMGRTFCSSACESTAVAELNERAACAGFSNDALMRRRP